MATRWGIVSAGIISWDFVGALKVYPEEEHQVVAVAARSLQDAQKFAAKNGIKSAYGSYSELAKDPDVEVVYIGTIQSCHLEVATLMMQAGKHVLCEKPMCLNVQQTKQIIRTARECGVFLMEAMWARFFPAYQELSRRLQAGEIGEVVQVIASFGKNLQHVDRLLKKETGGGATLEIGIYPIHLTTLVMGGDKPLKVLTGGHLNANGVEVTTSASLVYSKGRMASLSSTLRADLPSEAYIIGTKGTIKVPYPMWCSETLEGPWGKSSHPLPANSHVLNLLNSQGLMYEAAEVRRCLKEGLLESPGMPHSDSVTLAEVMEQIRTQAGNIFPQDNL